MRNLNPYKESSLDFYKEIINSKKNSKKDPDYKKRVENHSVIISSKFDEFDQFFGENNLIKLQNHDFKNDEKADLIKLYTYQNKLIQKLKLIVTTTERNRLLNTCQNCTLSEINSFDHFVNKDEFPEYSVHPNNLFPSCTKCNSFKGSEWKDGETIKYLNLYLDQLPDCQYLFADVIVEESIVLSNFYLKNIYNISPILFKRIENHYDNLYLCKRFRENSCSIVTSLENSIRIASSSGMPTKLIVKNVIELSKENMKYFGFNYWKSILEISLVNNTDFMNLVLEK